MLYYVWSSRKKVITLDNRDDKAKCPYLRDPFEDCYCSQMNSQMAEKVIKFCGGNFEECDIYNKHVREGGRAYV